MSFSKRIVLVSPGFAADEGDTVCIPPLQAYVEALVQNYPQLEIIVIALHYPKRKGIYKWKNVTVHSLHGERFSGIIKALYLIWKLQRLLTRLHQERLIDLVHSFWLNDTTFLAQRFTLKHRIPHCATIMGQDALSANRYLKLLHFNRLEVIAISTKAADAFRESTGKKVDHIIPWGIGNLDFDLGGYDEKTIDILGVGSLTTLKNYPLFIQLVEKLNREGLIYTVVLVGKGPGQSGLQQLIKEKGLEQSVKLMGEIPRDEVLKVMKASKVFLHTSTYEGQGYVFLEALAAGLPIVCFDVGFLPKTKKVHVCGNEGEMMVALRKVLSGSPDPDPVEVPLIEQTANAYWKIYF